MRRVYKPDEVRDAEERKRKGNGVAKEEPQKQKKTRGEEMAKFVKTLKRSRYLVFEQLKKLYAQIFILSFAVIMRGT